MRKHTYPTIGDYVLVSKYSDRDPQDTWHVGFISKVELVHGSILYSVEDGNRSYYKCCWRITRAEGNKIIAANDPSIIKLSKSPVRAYHKARRKK